MQRAKVCVVGSGGREHALQSVLSRDADVVVTPGNPGIPGSVPTKPEDIEADLFVIGPEAPLVDGLADRLRDQGKLVFGPGTNGALLEESKAWMKNLLGVARVPTADYVIVSSEAGAITAFEQIRVLGYPGWVIKTSGLAAGKGTTVTKDPGVAIQDVRDKLGGKFGEAGKILVIEGLLESKLEVPAYEVSIFAICNGTDYILLEGAQDYKRLSALSDLMTGGMGAYSPTRDQDKLAEWARVTILPVLEELRQRGINYRGVLYAGLIIVDGKPYVLEFNIRFGDPEAEVILPRITSNFVETLMQAAAGEPMSPVEFSDDIVVARVLCAEGYPVKVLRGGAEEGDVIQGSSAAEQLSGVKLFYAGVARDKVGRLVTSGGRVLVPIAIATSASAALMLLDEAEACVSWRGMHSRSDIGKELLNS